MGRAAARVRRDGAAGGDGALSANQPSISTEEERAKQLFEQGAARLAALWDDDSAMVRHAEHPAYHDPRGTLAYAGVLLAGAHGGSEAGGDTGPPLQPADAVARAERAVRSVLALQERRPDDAHCGNFRWMLEDEGVTDLNAVEFVLDGLIPLARDHTAMLSGEIVAEMHDAIALGLDAIDRLDVHPSYTNIALSDICNSVLGGEAIGDDAFVARGKRRLDEWFEFTNRSGAPHEFNSPTYCAVDIGRLAALAAGTSDPDLALKARIAEERLWLHVAVHYHPRLAQIAGPHSRSYFDGWSGAGGYLKLLLWRLLGDDTLRRETPYAPRSREEGHTGIAHAELHCPDYVLDWLRDKRWPFEAIETADAARGLDLATYMTGSYALGTASRTYTVGEPGEPWPAWNSTLLFFRRQGAPGYGSLFARYLVNDRDVGAVTYESTRVAEDLWEEGQFVGAQHRNRAIVAYGLVPRMRPAHSYKLSVRLLGASDAEIWIGEQRADAFPAAVEPGVPVVLAVGDAYIAVIPLEPSDMGSGAPIELRRADGVLMLDMYNYRGPSKTFWEHRSQAGPFFKGNVRNAFVLEVAERTAFAGLAAFRQHIGDARLTDSVDDGFVREIAYASKGGSLALRYSLWDMSPIARTFDGASYAAPMGRAGARDGGIRWLQSRESIIEFAGTKLLAGRTPKWLVADAERGRYIFVNPSDEVAPVWLETAHSVVECDAFGFGRIELDEGARAIAIEATGEIGPVRVRHENDMRLSINGTDVTDSMTAAGDGVREFGAM